MFSRELARGLKLGIDRFQVTCRGAAKSTVATFTERASRILDLGALVCGCSSCRLAPCLRGISTYRYSKNRSKRTATASAIHRFESQVPPSWACRTRSVAGAIVLCGESSKCFFSMFFRCFFDVQVSDKIGRDFCTKDSCERTLRSRGIRQQGADYRVLCSNVETVTKDIRIVFL